MYQERVMVDILCCYSMSCGIAQSFPDISCGWRRTQLKRLPTRVRGARGRILLRESILWNRGRVLILNLQMSNLKFILNIWIWEMRMRSLFHQTPILFHKVQRLHAIKDRYGWECFHWGLSSYEFPEDLGILQWPMWCFFVAAFSPLGAFW